MRERKVMVLNTLHLNTTETKEYLLSESLKSYSEDGSMQLTMLLLKRENSDKANIEKNFCINQKLSGCEERGYVIQTLTCPLSYHTEEKSTNQSRGSK